MMVVMPRIRKTLPSIMIISSVGINPSSHLQVRLSGQRSFCLVLKTVKLMRWMLFLVGCFCSLASAGPAPGPWTPIFKGIDHAVGTNTPGIAGNFPELQVVHCIRVDLTDPDVRLFPTPPAPNPVAESRETITQT